MYNVRMNKISQSFDLKQSQSLVMTPQLQQAIKLLQMSNVELNEFVEEELSENPLLEKKEEEINDHDEIQEIEQPKDEVQAEFDDAWTGNEKENKDFDAGSNMADVGAGGNNKFETSDNSYLENSITVEQTLSEFLLEQLHITTEDSRDRMVGALLIDQLDESGYLRANYEELATILGCSMERINDLLEKMRKFEPSGVFARDLADCLSIQLDEKKTLDEPMKKLIDNLDLLANHDIKKLCDICGVNETYLLDMVSEIKELNPKPASDYDHFVVQTVVPDVLMKAIPKNLGGGWKVELNSDTLPKVLVNREYYTQVSDGAINKKDKEYITEKLNSANWLVRAMDQRAQTILKVAGEIVESQNGFFLYGIEYLKPLTLKDVAEEIDMHESTVSRVTNNKYIGTPRGIFELKYFFTTALIGSDGQAHSAEAIKAKIRSLIDNEKSDNILSDDNIVKLLSEEGINIARRTISKYREALNIPSSIQRKKIAKSK